MFASQLIYTACGKDRTGAFGVWAKSADITKAESDEITKMMLYKRPADLPYEPTEEELETLFPKKFGYFLLSTGRYCIAQAVYIGKVYSDLDMRSGNYIIHAFVVEEPTGLLPMTMIGSDMFKKKLTYEEWHDNDAPEDLPKVELSQGQNGLSKAEAERFFTEDNGRKLELLLQALINSENSDKLVTFHDREENLQYWYRAISICIPKVMQDALTFCSFYIPTPQMPNQVPGAGQTEIKIRNVAPTVMASLFSYSQEVRLGKYAFDFENDIYNADITVSRYVHRIVQLLRENLFGALRMVDFVDKLMRANGSTLEEAAAVYSLQKCEFDWFMNLEEQVATLEKASTLIPESLTVIADGLYDDCILGGRWAVVPELLPVYRMVFDHSAKADRMHIIGKYVENHSAFGIADSLNCVEYAKQMQQKAPFGWERFLEYLFETPDFGHYLAAGGDHFNSRYLAYVSLIDGMAKLDAEKQQITHQYFLNLMVAAMKAASVEQFDALLQGIRKMGEKWETWLVKNALVTLLQGNARLTDVCDTDFLLNLVARLSNQALALLLLKQMAARIGNDSGFISRYVSKAATARERFDSLEAQLKTEEGFLPFVEQVEICRFKGLKAVTEEALDRYYKTYFVTGKDQGSFEKQLGEFIKAKPEQDAIDACIAAYKKWLEKLPDGHQGLQSCIAKLSDLMFRSEFAKLLQYAQKRGMGGFTPILTRLDAMGGNVPGKYCVLQMGMNTRRFVAKGSNRLEETEKQKIVNLVERNGFYGLLVEQAEIDQYIEFFLPDLVYMYLTIAADQEHFEPILVGCFGKPVESRRFAVMLPPVIEELDKQDYNQLMADLFSYAFGSEEKDPVAEKLKRFIERYLDASSRGKRKKIFAGVLETVTENYAQKVKRYIDKYQKEHESFFEKLFGGKKHEPVNGDATADATKRRKK